MYRGSISHSLVRTVVDVAEARGADRGSLLACIGVNEDSFQDDLSRVSLEKVIVLFQLIIEQTGDQAIGLHVAEEIRPGSLSALGYAMMSCSNSQQAIELQKSFGGVIADCADFTLVKDDKYGNATFTVKDENLELVRPINDMFIAIFWVYGKWITRVDAELAGVSFTHSPTSYVDEYKRILGVTPTFSEADCGMIFDLAHLEAPLFQPDADMNLIMTQKTENMHRDLKSKKGLEMLVAKQVRALLPIQKATLTMVASSLNMSERSLSRKLKEEGFSYKTILANVRSATALDYLKDFNYAVISLHSLLGYRDHSAFSHAFRSWTGYSPTDYRAKLEKDRGFNESKVA